MWKNFKLSVSLLLLIVLPADICAQASESDFRAQQNLLRVSQMFHPHKVSGRFVELYKRTYNLNEAVLPFNSFQRIYPKHNRYPNLIMHQKNCFGDQISTPIAMMSNDNECILYIQTLSQFGEGWKKKDISDLREFLALEIRCNRDELYYWQDKMSEEQIDSISNDNIRIFENCSYTELSNSDALFLCHFPCREKIGVYIRNTYSPVHEEYPHFCTLVFYKNGEVPIKMHMFLSDEGWENIDNYLTAICISIKR